MKSTTTQQLFVTLIAIVLTPALEAEKNKPTLASAIQQHKIQSQSFPEETFDDFSERSQNGILATLGSWLQIFGKSVANELKNLASEPMKIKIVHRSDGETLSKAKYISRRAIVSAGVCTTFATATGLSAYAAWEKTAHLLAEKKYLLGSAYALGSGVNTLLPIILSWRAVGHTRKAIEYWNIDEIAETPSENESSKGC